MDAILIRGGRPLTGEVEVSGAKNAALPLLFASLLTPETCRLSNVPRVVDCRTTQKLLAQLGVEVSCEDDVVTMTAETITAFEAPYDLVKTMRASFLALGPLLARFGEARVATPGGCAIGSRPVNLHLRGFERMGATISQHHGYVEARAPLDANGRPRLRAAHIVLEMPSVGATENLMLAASLADGTTVIDNAAREPEIVDLADALVKMGVVIRGAGSATIEVEGRESVGGFDHAVIPDRIEAGTMLMAVAAAGGDVFVRNARAGDLTLVLEKLAEAGVTIEPHADGIRVASDGELKAVDVRTAARRWKAHRSWRPTCAPACASWSRRWDRRTRPSCSACTTSTAATSASRRSSPASARRSSACARGRRSSRTQRPRTRHPRAA